MSSILQQRMQFRRLKPSVGTRLIRDHPSVKGLGAFWLLNEGGGDKVYDLSGFGLTGIITGADWGIGRDGSTLDFSIDRYTDYVDFGTPNLYSSQMTVEMLVQYVAPGDGDINMIVGEYRQAQGDGWMLHFNANNILDHKVRFSGDGQVSVVSTSILSDGQLVHIIVTVDGTTTTIYLDGLSDVADTTPAVTTGGDLRMGFPEDPSTQYRGLNSKVYYCRIYPQRTLIAEEVRGLFLNPYGMIEWPMVWLGTSLAGQLYYQSIAGVFTPAGLVVKKTETLRVGILTPAGVVIKKTETPKAGVITFVGVSSRTMKFARSILSGMFIPSGVLVKKAAKIFAGAITFVGVSLRTMKFARTVLAGAITPSGVAIKKAKRVLTGALTSSGALIRKAKKVLAGSLTPIGVSTKKTEKSFVGALTFVGTLTLIRLFHKILVGAITFTGTLTRKTSKMLAGAITLGGAISKLTRKIFSGALTFIGRVTGLAPVIPTPLTLYDRSTELTLNARSTDLTLESRSTDLTLPSR